MSIFYNLIAFQKIIKAKGPLTALTGLHLIDRDQVGLISLLPDKKLYYGLLIDATSYIKNYDDVFSYLNKIDILYITQYVSLAGKRSYADIKAGKNYLDLSLYPDLDINSVKHNPLLTIDNNNLKFNYE